MCILADKNFTLETHTAFMYRPTTLQNEALKQAQRLNLSIDGDFSKSGKLDIVNKLGKLSVIKNRRSNDAGYGNGHAFTDIAKLSGGVTAISALALAGSGGSLPVAISIPAGIVFAGAMYKASKKALGTGADLLEVGSPERHEQLKKGGWI